MELSRTKGGRPTSERSRLPRSSGSALHALHIWPSEAKHFRIPESSPIPYHLHGRRGRCQLPGAFQHIIHELILATILIVVYTARGNQALSTRFVSTENRLEEEVNLPGPLGRSPPSLRSRCEGGTSILQTRNSAHSGGTGITPEKLDFGWSCVAAIPGMMSANAGTFFKEEICSFHLACSTGLSAYYCGPSGLARD